VYENATDCVEIKGGKCARARACTVVVDVLNMYINGYNTSTSESTNQLSVLEAAPALHPPTKWTKNIAACFGIFLKYKILLF
jgi:hypothetical protein